MDYHLKPIQQFISNYLTPDNTFVERLHDVILDSLLIKLDEQFEMIKGQISESYYSFDEESTSTHFIQNHQHKIVIMTNQLSLNLAQENGTATKSKKTIQKVLIEKLSFLLNFLETEYAHCLDTSYNITSAYGNEKAMEYAKFLAKLDSPFYYCDSLMKIAIEPLNTFIQSDKTIYKHFKIKYLNRLCKELDLLQRTYDFGFKQKLKEVLISINFNNSDFMLYLTKMILDEVYRQDTVEEQLLKLRWHQKYFRQQATKNDMAFLIHRANIKDQIVSWISEEINFLESSNQPLTINIQNKRNVPFDNKILLNVSVEQFALLIKAGIESGLLIVEDVRAFSRLVCKYFSTKKQANMSDSSLRNRIYKFEIEDPDALKSNIINWIKDYI